MFLFPQADVNRMGEVKIINGILSALPSFCRSCERKNCIEHYRTIISKPGFHICPHGFTSHVYHLDGMNIINTGIRVNSHYDRKKTKKNIQADYVPQYSVEHYEGILPRSKEYQRKFLEMNDLKIENSQQKKFIEITLHEIRKLNASIKAQSEELSHSLDSCFGENCSHVNRLKLLQDNIFGTSSIVSLRLNTFDFQSNRQNIINQEQKNVGVYKKFDKVRKCLYVQSHRDNKKINMIGKSRHLINAYEVFDILPFLLLDNAVKFSPPNQEIRVTFDEKNPLSVSVESLGPKPSLPDLDILFEQDYRDETAKKVAEGSGLGLCLAKEICELHDIEINIKTEHTGVNLNGIQYVIFKVEMIMKTCRNFI